MSGLQIDPYNLKRPVYLVWISRYRGPDAARCQMARSLLDKASLLETEAVREEMARSLLDKALLLETGGTREGRRDVTLPLTVWKRLDCRQV